MFQGTGFGSSTSSPFGSTAYKPATSVFNTGPMFGSTGSSSLFGSNTTQPSTGLFGATTTPAFGQTQQPQNTFGGFTATSNAGTGLFGAQQNANTGGLFGSTTTPFGQNKPAFGGFGTTNQSTGLFGQQTTPAQPNQPIFGQPQAQQTTGLFGATTVSAFGGGAAAGGAGGTTIKFTPVTGTDTMVKNGVSTQISTRHHCITCMKEYESKSLEELRLEDYVANRKGPQQGAQATGGLFGAPTQQPSLFGTQSSTASTGLFGTNTDNKSVFGATSTGFGAPNTNLFGGNVGSMFNKPAGAATPFGTTPTSSTATTNFGFNSNASNNLFGQTTQPGFFSNTSQPSTAFGTPTSGFAPFGSNQQQGGLFSQNKPTFSLGSNTNAGFSFGSTATTNSTLTSSFPANKTTPFSTFGTPASTSAGFGQSPFGQAPNQSSSFFSNSFNKPASSGFAFGNTTTTNTPGTGLNFNSGISLFNQNQNKPGGLFNTNSSNLFNMNNSFSGNSFNTGTTGLNSTFSLGTNQANNSLLPSFGQNAATPQNNALNQYMLVLASMPFGDSPLFKNLVPSTSKSDESIKPTSPAAMKSLQSGINHKVLPNSRSKVKIVKPNSMTRNSLFDGLDEDEEELNSSLTSLDSSGVKNHRLNVRSLHLKSRQFNLDSSLSQSYSETNNNSNDTGYNNMTSPQPQDQSFTRLIKKNIVFQPGQLNDSDMNRTSDRIVISPLAKLSDSSMNNSKLLEMSNASLDSSVIEDPLRRRPDVNLKRLELSKMHIGNVNSQSENKEAPEQSTSTSSSGESEAEECGTQSEEPHPTGIVLTRAGYYTIPSLSDLAQLMDSEGRCIVDNFTIGRLNYGNVFYPESFDVANLNLDKIVHFRHKEVVIYPDDEDKPPVGSGLNRRAQVTLDCVWPVDKQTRQPISDPSRLQSMDFEEKLRKATVKHGTRFIEYRPQTGSWVFKVDHFSKYALTDSDEEDGGGTSVKPTKFPSASMPGKEQLNPTQQQDAAASASALQAAQKYRARKSVIDDQMDVQLDPLSVHLFLEDEDEEMADGPFDLYEMDGILSPTSKLSQQLGTSAHKLQLMKASFFEPDLPIGEDHMEAGDDVFQGSSLKPVLRLSSIPMGEQYSSNNMSLTMRQRIDDIPKPDYSKSLILPSEDNKNEESEEECVIDNEAASSRPVLYQVDYGSSWLEHKESTLLKSGLEGYLADQVFARGLSFKASWGPSGVLTTVETDFPFFINTLSLTSIDHQSFKESVLEQLEGALKSSVISTESGTPLALCPDGVATLTRHLNIARRQPSTPQMFLNAFALCHALWGELPTTDSADTSYNISLARKEAVSSWLETVTAPLAKSDLDNVGDSPASVFALMSCHSVMEACKLAISLGDKRLSLVLCQAGSGRIVRGLVDRQLTEWRETQADRHIDPDRIILYMLSAGKLTHQTSESLISACQSLDWIRAFALHLWYVCWTTSSVSEALNEYDKAWSGKEKYAPSPVPPHIDSLDDSDSPSSLLYHLLKLYSDRSHPVDLLLNPETHTPDALDYRLSWFLMRVLLSLGYSHLSEYNTCLIHTSFASQLELYGLWHWAVFVLLHIDSDQREKLICDTIERHIIHEKDDNKEKFLRDRLKIPVAWIASAKATRALVNKRYEEAARNLLLAGEWNHAHDIIMKHIASAAMVNNKYSMIEDLFGELEKEDRFREILSWDTGGLVLLEYLRGVSLIESLRQNGHIDEALHDLKHMAQRIYSRIKLLPNTSPMDRLCQTELSERLVKLLPEVPLDDSFSLNSQITDKNSQWQPWDMESLNNSLSS